MKRSRVFVLREAQSAVLPQVKNILLSCITDNEDDYTDKERCCVAESIKGIFDVEFSIEDTRQEWGMEEYGLAGHVAKLLLDKDPPDTKPPWSAPW